MTSETISVSNLMNRNVQTDFEDQNIMSACNIMYANEIGSVIIVTINASQTPVGIITERDIVRILGKLNPDLLQTPLRMLMSKPVITIEESASINDASKIMNTKKIRRLVAVDRNNKMTGILTQKDIFRQIAKSGGLIADLLGTDYPPEHKEIYDRFGDFMSDLLPKL